LRVIATTSGNRQDFGATGSASETQKPILHNRFGVNPVFPAKNRSREEASLVSRSFDSFMFSPEVSRCGSSATVLDVKIES
jgi:hypothetical protein